MNTSRKGARAENLCRRTLERQGYTVVRAAASHGPFDLVAVARRRVLFIAVFSGRFRKERVRALAGLACPRSCWKEAWIVRGSRIARRSL